MFQFEAIDKHPPVVQLDVHLQNHHAVYFKENQQGCATRQAKPEPKITEWFSANCKWPGASHIRYLDFPCYYI